jgi:hypothetical protein
MRISSGSSELNGIVERLQSPLPEFALTSLSGLLSLTIPQDTKIPGWFLNQLCSSKYPGSYSHVGLWRPRAERYVAAANDVTRFCLPDSRTKVLCKLWKKPSTSRCPLGFFLLVLAFTHSLCDLTNFLFDFFHKVPSSRPIFIQNVSKFPHEGFMNVRMLIPSIHQIPIPRHIFRICT